MDRSRYKRREQNSLSHTNNKNFGNSQSVTEFVAVNSSQKVVSSNQPTAATLRPEASVSRAPVNLRPTNLQPLPRRQAAPTAQQVARLSADVRDRLRTPQPQSTAASTPKPVVLNNEFVAIPVAKKAAAPELAPVKPKMTRRMDIEAPKRTPISSVMPQLATLETTQSEVAASVPNDVDLVAPAEQYDDYYKPGFFDMLTEKIDTFSAKIAAKKQNRAAERAQKEADRAAEQAQADNYDEFPEYEAPQTIEQEQVYEEAPESYEPAPQAAIEAPATIEQIQPVAEIAPAPIASQQPTKVLTGLGPLDMELPGEETPSMYSRIRSRKARKWALRGMAVGMVLVITTGGLLVSQSYLKANKVFRGSTGTAAALKKEVTPDLLDGEGSGRVNVLLLGRGGGAHDAPDLTDTVMIASIDPVNKKTTLLSIPRDLWVTVPGQGTSKLNAAFEKGVYAAQGSSKTNSTDPVAIKAGFKLADQTITEATGLTINYNVVLNFDAFKQAIDTVNGVSINVPADLIDPTMAWENGNDPVLAHAGPQVMNGVKALQYTRSRETTSDFARSERQRAVMLALKDKIVSMGTLSNPAKLSGLISAFGNNVTTDLSMKNAARLYELTKGISDTNITSLDLASGTSPLVTTGNISGQSVVIPKAGLFKYDAIKTFLHTQLKDPYILKENARVRVLNGSLLPGLATSQSDELKTYGYNVIGAANTPTSGYTQTTVVDLTKGKDKFTKHYLEQRYGVTAKTAMPDDTIATNNADFVIIIGSDQATPPQTATR